MTEPTNDMKQDSRWHIGKEIPLALIAAVVVQTAGGAMWLATLSNKVDSAIDQLKEFKADRYTKEDARRDRELTVLLIQSLQARDTEIERRVGLLEAPPRMSLK